MNKLLREPLLHFLLIGGLLFLLLSGSDSAGESETILIDQDDIERLKSSWKTQQGKEPSNEELQRLIDNEIQQEIYYQEALRMSLDHNDEIVKRRLAQKMEFVMTDIAAPEVPSEQALKAYFEGHKDHYRTGNKRSLSNIYFNPDKRENPNGDAEKLLQRLQSHSDTMNFSQFGDAMPIEVDMNSKTFKEFQILMGGSFANEVFKAKEGSWLGPIGSGYGVHLVKVTNHDAGNIPEWDAIVQQLTIDYQQDLQQEEKDALFKGFKKQYAVRVDWDLYESKED